MVIFKFPSHADVNDLQAKSYEATRNEEKFKFIPDEFDGFTIIETQ